MCVALVIYKKENEVEYIIHRRSEYRHENQHKNMYMRNSTNVVRRLSTTTIFGPFKQFTKTSPKHHQRITKLSPQHGQNHH